MGQTVTFKKKEWLSTQSLLIRAAMTGVILLVTAWLATACVPAQTNPAPEPSTITQEASAQANAAPDAPLPQEIPPLPFADNPDPTLCGLPQPDGREGVITGEYNGEVVQPIVYLYNSHLRDSIVGQVYPGTKVKITLRQSNPSLDYFFVETIDVDPPQKGWAPAPFVEIEQ